MAKVAEKKLWSLCEAYIFSIPNIYYSGARIARSTVSNKQKQNINSNDINSLINDAQEQSKSTFKSMILFHNKSCCIEELVLHNCFQLHGNSHVCYNHEPP